MLPISAPQSLPFQPEQYTSLIGVPALLDVASCMSPLLALNVSKLKSNVKSLTPSAPPKLLPNTLNVTGIDQP